MKRFQVLNGKTKVLYLFHVDFMWKDESCTEANTTDSTFQKYSTLLNFSSTNFNAFCWDFCVLHQQKRCIILVSCEEERKGRVRIKRMLGKGFKCQYIYIYIFLGDSLHFFVCHKCNDNICILWRIHCFQIILQAKNWNMWHDKWILDYNVGYCSLKAPRLRAFSQYLLPGAILL